MSASVLPIRPEVAERILPARAPFAPGACGYRPIYRVGEVNYCPGCHRSHWIVGRLLAECAFCATALPLSEA